MWRFIVRRTALALVIILLGAFIIYGVMRCMPTSFVESLARQRAAASATTGGPTYQEWLEQLNEAYHMNDNVVMGYLNWLGGVLKGDFGVSWKYGIPVTQKFSQVIWYSVVLNTITLILEVLICIPLGIQAARHQYSGFDYGITVFAMLCISLPTFFLATVLKFAFAVKLNWFDLYGIVGRYHEQLSASGKIWDMVHHMVLPVLTLTLLVTGRDWHRRSLSRWYDTLLFIAGGLAGCILFFLICFSTHEATSPNINIVWLNPLLLLLAVLPWFKKTRGAARLLHALNAVIVALLMLAWPWQPQVGDWAFFPLMAALVMRSGINVLLGAQTTRGPTPVQG